MNARINILWRATAPCEHGTRSLSAVGS